MTDGPATAEPNPLVGPGHPIVDAPPVYPGQQPSAYPVQQIPAYPVQQLPAYPGQQPPAYPVQQPPARSPRLGLVAMIVAICVTGLSLLASILIGTLATTLFTYRTATSAGFNLHPDQALGATHALLGSVFGIWALTQGIVAVAQNRGRRFGIVAIVLAAAAPIVSVIVWAALGAAFGHHAGS